METPSSFKPQISFTTDRIPMAALGPFSAPGKYAVPKDQMAFLVVCIGDVTPETPVSTNDMAFVVQDGKGATYCPIAFGCPMQGAEEKITLIGFLKNGDILIQGAQKSVVGVIFTIPKGSKELTLLHASTKTPISLSDKYQPSAAARINNILCSGRLNTLAGGETWEVK